ncbi:MAG: aminopeptidase P family protein [Clostridia bacterium]|nr:aminopeptidase P family protein [Clostridia bacterium]
MTINSRVQRLREEMAKENIYAYLIPSDDFHQSEYVADYFKAREYISGFTGSAGTALVTMDEALLWVDGRYFIQGEKEIAGTEFRLMKMGEAGVPTVFQYLKEHCKDKTLAFDGRCISYKEGLEYSKSFKLEYNLDLVDRIWDARPKLPDGKIWELPIKYAGESREAKIQRVRKAMKEVGAEYHLLSTLDDICWLLNIRGNDIEYFPMCLSYLLISQESVNLYLNRDKLDDIMAQKLNEAGVQFFEYDRIYSHLEELSSGAILADPDNINYLLYTKLHIALIEKENPEILFKAIKNQVEIENIKKAQIMDSLAHVRFMKWLKERPVRDGVLQDEGKDITEIDASMKLESFRREFPSYIQPSFDPISAVGEHGAIIHYSATPESNEKLRTKTLYLSDTGAGFYEGSTDITRTFALGEISDKCKADFALVLKANLRLANAKFVKGTKGATLDMLAREPFWAKNKDYKHGTGHGVGYLLNIHEGPQNISFGRGGKALEPGMVVTDEPGIYIENEYGIRLENELLTCVDSSNEFGEFYRFQIISYIPFDLDAINPDDLGEEDKALLNEYHREVYNKLSPYLKEEECQWLLEYTKEI